MLKKPHSLWTLFLPCLFSLFFALPAMGEELFYLVKDSIPQIAIAYTRGQAGSKEAQEVARKIRLFNAKIKRLSGTELPLSTSPQAAGKAKLHFVISGEKLLAKEDAFSFEFQGKDLIVKCSSLSLQWAINHILEENGVTFLYNGYKGVAFSPRKTLSLPKKARTFQPSFPMGRYTYLPHPRTIENFYMKTGAKCNHDQYIHSFPKAKYHKNNSYPEAIRPIRNGKRLAKIPANPALYWQPCYSSPETARIAVENIREYLAKNPDTQSISVTVNDNGGFCECNDCKKINGLGVKYTHSQVYFTWVNRVARELKKSHPSLLIVSLAYSQVYQPPTFSMEDNVMIVLCVDVFSIVDKKIREKHEAIVRSWSSKAKRLGLWDYSWGWGYIPPRVYFDLHKEYLRFLHKHGGCYYFGESEGFDLKDGPKYYLVHKLLWDIDSDVEKLLARWYEACVGKKAAPYLRKYFEHWENYYAGETIRKTPWFKSKASTYMTFSDISHIYGIKNEDIAKARALMEKVVKYAGKGEKKDRANFYMRNFQYLEALLKLNGAGVIPPEGKLKTSAEALKLLNELEGRLAYQKLYKEIVKEMDQDPVLGPLRRAAFRNLLHLNNNGVNTAIDHVVMAANFAAGDKRIAAKLKSLGESRTLPPILSHLCRVLASRKPHKNLFVNGDLETGSDKGFDVHREHRKFRGKISTEMAYSGKHSWKVTPGAYTLVLLENKAKPDTYYLVTCKLYIAGKIPESTLEYVTYPIRNGQNQKYVNLPLTVLEQGKWHTLTMVCKTTKTSDGIRSYFFLRNFPLGKAVYIDDVRMTELNVGTK